MKFSRQVIAFALLRQCSELTKTDLLGGVSLLIRPLIKDLEGEVYDSRVLASRLEDAYGLVIPFGALEGMVDRFVSADILFLEKTENGVDRVVYSVSQGSKGEDDYNEESFQAVLDDFLRHAEDRLSAVGKTFTGERLIQEFLRRLSTLDFSSIKVRPFIDSGPKSILSGPTSKEIQSLSDQLEDAAIFDALVASYVTHLAEYRPSVVELLASVADGALAAELVFDLQAPKSVPRISSTTVVLDTPLLLSCLDLSSSQDAADVRGLISQIKQAGAKIAAFQHSVDEAEGVMEAIQNARVVGNAYGPSIHRLSNSAYRAYFDSMKGRIRKALKDDWGCDVIPSAANHYFKNFSETDEESLRTAIQINLYDRLLTRERDAKSVAETIRRLGGAHFSMNSIGAVPYIFVTPNMALQSRVAAFLRREEFVLGGEFNPIVTSHYLSGLCWLICGGKSTQSPTLAKLLANCANALRVKPEVSAQVKKFLSQIDPEKALHFEALMTNERVSHYLTEVTLGGAGAITANNVVQIFEELQAKSAEKVAMEKDLEYQGKISELRELVQSNEGKVASLQEELQATALDANIKSLEIENLTKRAALAEKQNAENNEKIARQGSLLEGLQGQALEAKKSAEAVRSQLISQQSKSRQMARVFAERRARQIRWIGVVIFFAVALSLSYFDKFLISQFSDQDRYLFGVFVIVVQSILAVLGFALIFESIVQKPLAKLTDYFYLRRLRELGISSED